MHVDSLSVYVHQRPLEEGQCRPFVSRSMLRILVAQPPRCNGDVDYVALPATPTLNRPQLQLSEKVEST